MPAALLRASQPAQSPTAAPAPPPPPAPAPPSSRPSEVVPGLLILLPATAGGVAKALEFYGQAAGVQLPETLPSVLALCLVAGIAGVGKARAPGGERLQGSTQAERGTVWAERGAAARRAAVEGERACTRACPGCAGAWEA